MIAFFTAAEQGNSELSRYQKLSEWWASFSKQPSLRKSDPGLPNP
jgi:hypothetical protein